MAEGTGPVWAPRPEPLPVAAATAPPEATGHLLHAVAARVRDGAVLRLVAGPAGCLVLGAADDLPWCAGVVYLGWEGGVLVPTARGPAPAADLVLAALRDRLPPGHGLVALVPWGVLAAPPPAAPVDTAAMAALLRAGTAG